MAMRKTGYITILLTGFLATLLLGSCSTDDVAELPLEEGVPVRFEIKRDGIMSRAPGDAALSVNRILILPFRKTDEASSNDAANFIPEYSAARQLDVNSFPAVVTMLTLSAASTYQLLVIGYNRSDYDFTGGGGATKRFNIGSTDTPATLANLYLQPVNPTVVPEFFSCFGNGYRGTTLVGPIFKPSQINYVTGTLKRLVSGFTLEVTNVPAYVNSMTLIAEQLVTATRATDGTALTWQTAGDGGTKTLATQAPVSGKVSFNQFLLAIPDSRKTLFYLDVSSYGLFTERYTVKLSDTPGVVSGNRIIFTPNHWVKVTGSYANINIGFTLAGNINLDDNAWDGLQ